MPPLFIKDNIMRYYEYMLKMNKEADEKEAELMVITAEECGELTQACMKVLRRGGIDNEYRQKLTEEIGDVYCMIELMVDNRIIDWKEVLMRVDEKKEKLKVWSNLINE